MSEIFCMFEKSKMVIYALHHFYHIRVLFSFFDRTG
jgi:hypothetical protein